MATIAIVTSTSYGLNNQASFNAGLTSSLGGQPQPTIPPALAANGIYDSATLRNLVRTAANSRPDLIVTAGGLVTAMAAAAELTQPNDPKCVFLSGTDLPAGTPTLALAGGVNMNNPDEDIERKRVLTDPPFNVPPGQIYLVVNHNAPMSDIDAHNWPPAKVARFFSGGANPPTNANDTSANNHFIAEFRALAGRSPRPRGLVISADPYFRLWRTAFTIALAHEIPVPVCYAFQDFLDAIDAQPGKPNLANSRALDLPRLNNPAIANDPDTAYFKLGSQAGRFISGTADVGVIDWDARNTQWLPPRRAPTK
jgi:hypothetical protein